MDNSKVCWLLLVITLMHVCMASAENEKLDPGTVEYTEQCEDGHRKINNSFEWADYTLLGAMLVISCGIGAFYGFFGDKQTTSSDFLLGGSSMGTFPMAMSLGASFVTAIELLGNPAEMYSYGSQYWMVCISFILVVPLTSKLYLPVYMKLRLTSTYEYLQMRFSPKTSYLASGLYILQMVLYTSVAVYAPALALSHVTGLNVYIAITVVYIVCIFYASQGGMKAVIITDTFQVIVLISSMLVILYLGEQLAGGTGAVWSHNYNTTRLEIFRMNPNPTIRTSFWSVVLGGTFYWMTMFCSNQASVQKYLSVENISQVRSALWISAVGLILIYTINFYTGMILTTNYRDCDPLKAGDIKAFDELLPLYVISELGHIKGITGFFVAGIFAASLGTVAAALNSLSAVTLHDFVTGAFGYEPHDNKGALWAKCISIGYGALSFALIFIVEQLGSVMQVALSFNGMVGGTTLGLFSLGMFFPWANAKGAISGGITSMAIMMWMGIGQQIAIATGKFVYENKPTSIDNCPCLNTTISQDLFEHNENEVFFLYRISYLWYSAIGFLITIIIGLIVSLITGTQDPHDLDTDLISPPIQELLSALPNSLKEKLNIPLKLKPTNVNKKEKTIIGIVNVTLDIGDESITNSKISNGNTISCPDKEAIRKFSTISY